MYIPAVTRLSSMPTEQMQELYIATPKCLEAHGTEQAVPLAATSGQALLPLAMMQPGLQDAHGDPARCCMTNSS